MDANPYCFVNPSITKRRTEGMRRFTGVRPTLGNTKSAVDFDVIGDGGALFVAFRLDFQDGKIAFVQIGQGFF